mmetsp:Transcript_3045/g.5184  ORF Transcript_3045/g.5184 Transcript_3045/m.5184 type:complete len:100 (-) Transcript_3045:540-839(-)
MCHLRVPLKYITQTTATQSLAAGRLSDRGVTYLPAIHGHYKVDERALFVLELAAGTQGGLAAETADGLLARPAPGSCSSFLVGGLCAQMTATAAAVHKK